MTPSSVFPELWLSFRPEVSATPCATAVDFNYGRQQEAKVYVPCGSCLREVAGAKAHCCRRPKSLSRFGCCSWRNVRSACALALASWGRCFICSEPRSARNTADGVVVSYSSAKRSTALFLLWVFLDWHVQGLLNLSHASRAAVTRKLFLMYLALGDQSDMRAFCAALATTLPNAHGSSSPSAVKVQL